MRSTNADAWRELDEAQFKRDMAEYNGERTNLLHTFVDTPPKKQCYRIADEIAQSEVTKMIAHLDAKYGRTTTAREREAVDWLLRELRFAHYGRLLELKGTCYDEF